MEEEPKTLELWDRLTAESEVSLKFLFAAIQY